MKCDDYNIIKIRFFASNYYLKKWDIQNEPAPKQHIERANNINDWFLKYMYNTKDVMIDYIYETYGIIIRTKGEDGYYYFFIPKKMKKEFKWLKTHNKNPYKIIKKTTIHHLEFYFSKQNIKFRREESEEFTKSSEIHKQLSRQNKLKRILDEDN
jgi:hypothetical protein